MPEANDEPYIAPEEVEDLDAIVEEEAEIPPLVEGEEVEEQLVPRSSLGYCLGSLGGTMKVIVRKTREEKYIVEVSDDAEDIVSEALAHIRIYAKEPDQIREYSQFEFKGVK